MSYLLCLFALLYVSVPLNMESNAMATTAVKPVACQFFTLANAEKLIGGKVVGQDDEHATDDGGQRWGCTFAPAAADGPKIYFLVLRNKSEGVAKEQFDKIRQSNKNHAGFEEWPGVADEAVFHSDGTGFHFVMIRKNTGTIRIKVNPAKGVSLDDLKTVAASLAAKMK
jgi:hypothetical protein